MKIKNFDQHDHRTRNPSPPPLTEAERVAITGDFIGNTVFSQHWVLDTLLKLYKHEESTIYTATGISQQQNDVGDVSENHTHNTTPRTSSNEENNITREQQRIVNSTNNERQLQTCFENDLCQLWDMTANTEVALFLNDNDVKSVLRDALKRTQSPRLMEICFGILGNLLCVKEIRISYTMANTDTPHRSREGREGDDSIHGGGEEFRAELLSYLTVLDALSLVELTRLLCTCVSCSSCSLPWIHDLLRKNRHYIGQLVYLLKNSLNVDLLCHVVKLLDIIFDDEHEDVSIELMCDDLIVGLIEANDQLHEQGCSKSEYRVSLVHLLQRLTESNKGFELMSKRCGDIVSRFLPKYFQLLDDEDGDGEGNHGLLLLDKLTIYASMLSLMASLLLEHSESIFHCLTTNLSFLKHCIFYLRYVIGKVLDESANEVTLLSICMDALSPLISQIFAANTVEGFSSKDLEDSVKDLLISIRKSVLQKPLAECCDSIGSVIQL